MELKDIYIVGWLEQYAYYRNLLTFTYLIKGVRKYVSQNLGFKIFIHFANLSTHNNNSLIE